jgi:hypothetical protein
MPTRAFCDCCDEPTRQLFDITRIPELASVVRQFGYRAVCQACYDNLFEELEREREREEKDVDA